MIRQCSELHAGSLAKGLLHAKLCVEIAKTNSVLASATSAAASSAFSKQPPTKSPDIYFAQMQSRESVHCNAIIMVMWKIGNLKRYPLCWFQIGMR